MTRQHLADAEEAERALRHWMLELPRTLREMRTELLYEEYGTDFPFDFDFGPASLGPLEAHMLAEYGPGEKVRMDFGPTKWAMAYVGEVLLTIAGGTWGWNRRGVPGSAVGHPVICPDPALGLQPMAPLLLVAYATRNRTGDAFAREVARLRQEVALRQEREPGWEPTTALHPVEAERRSGADHPELLEWLDAHARAFPSWAEEAGEPERWDFGPGTLDLLEEVVRAKYADAAAIEVAKSSPFVQGAVWYIGETVRRHCGGVVWQYQPGTPYIEAADSVMFSTEEHGVFNTPLLGQPGLRQGNRLYPLGALNTLYWETDELDEPMDDHLCDLLDGWA
ncbi:hypothetical protein P8605_39205 [Streptomyces sp. T-3]|nr:hypothetical protein [Streptomyces sp. T-3]